jgi:long-chain acyl-CoA synthetase
MLFQVFYFYLSLLVQQNGKYTFMTYSELGEQVDQFRGALAKLGVKKGDMIAVISRNRLEWVLTAYGGHGLGAVNVPMYEQQKEADWRFIIKDSGASVLVVSTVEIYEKVKSFAPELGVRHILCCDLPSDHPDSFAAVFAAGKSYPTPIEVSSTFPMYHIIVVPVPRMYIYIDGFYVHFLKYII